MALLSNMPKVTKLTFPGGAVAVPIHPPIVVVGIIYFLLSGPPVREPAGRAVAGRRQRHASVAWR
jgi:hypothetical protein